MLKVNVLFSCAYTFVIKLKKMSNNVSNLNFISKLLIYSEYNKTANLNQLETLIRLQKIINNYFLELIRFLILLKETGVIPKTLAIYLSGALFTIPGKSLIYFL